MPASQAQGYGGELHADGINAVETHGFLVCTTCGCTYAIGATKAVRR